MKLLEKLINKELKYLLKNMWIWEKRFYKNLFSNIMINRTTIFRKLINTNNKKVDKMSEQATYFFEKENFSNFSDKVSKRCFSMVWQIHDNDYICIDEVDIAKPFAKKMKNLAKVRDWSTWNIVSWFMFHWVSIRWIPVILEYEDLENKFKAEYFWKIIKKILSYSKWKWTIVLDAWYDIAAYIDYLYEVNANFIVRAKKNRIYFDVKSWKYLKLKEFWEWTFEVKIPKVRKTVFLHIKTNPKFNEPMRILSNSEKTNVKEYSKRWEIESIFKTMKQEFELEKIQTKSFLVVKNMVATIQLAMALSRLIYNQTTSFKDVSKIILYNKFVSKFLKFTKKLGLTMNPNSIVKFISYCLSKIYKIPPLKIINKNNRVLPQLSLF